MLYQKIEDLKHKIIEDALKNNYISKAESQMMDEEFLLNYAKNNNFSEYVLLQTINHAKFTIVVRDKSIPNKFPLRYSDQMFDDILNLWMSGISEAQLLVCLKDALDNGITYITIGKKEYNIILETLFDKPVDGGGIQGTGDKIKSIILDYKQKIDNTQTDEGKKQLREELLNMICGFYEIEI